MRGAIQEEVVKQEEPSILGKLGPTFLERILAKEACQKTSKELRQEYLDICLCHWLQGWQPGKDFFSKDNKGHGLTSKLMFLGAWEAIEELVDEGQVRAFAVFNHFEIKRLLNKPRLK